MRFRWRMLPIARSRAVALNSAGALYPWRTINGEEASAYYAAGTAQYHIDAAIAFALKRYVDASGDIAFLATDGAEILVETARMWNDLGFYSTPRTTATATADATFHIHGVTGPDEYTAVVNDNLYTNVMARFNLRYAARARVARRVGAGRLRRSCATVDLGDHEAPAWCAPPKRCTCRTTRSWASIPRTPTSSTSSPGTSTPRRPRSTPCC